LVAWPSGLIEDFEAKLILKAVQKKERTLRCHGSQQSLEATSSNRPT
jgi:hypothetical protein